MSDEDQANPQTPSPDPLPDISKPDTVFEIGTNSAHPGSPRPEVPMPQSPESD
ncbi:MAG: hypothetical protein Q7Q73_02545 [Verrucomicrobiota bacterium JB024]|nr:hypothetical protein [Verrucomicrobiota bacterium JB024]